MLPGFETLTSALRGVNGYLVLAGLLFGGIGWVDAEETFFETVDVELVNVEIWPRDAKGEPVTGLTVDDFEVRHDGEVVELSHFAEIRGGRSVEAAKPTDQQDFTPPEEPSHLVIYFDQLRLHPNHYEPLIRDLETFLQSGAVDPERVLIMRQEDSLYVEANFGSNLRQLRKALTGMRKAEGRSSGLGSDEEQALDQLRRAWEEAQTTAGSRATGLAAAPTGAPGTGGSTGPRSAVGGAGTSFFGRENDACGLFLNRVQPILDGWAYDQAQRIAVSLRHLKQSGTYFAALPGVKTVLYLSDGLELHPASALGSFVGRLCPSGQGNALQSSATDDVARLMTRLTRHLNTNQVTVHSLQAGGLEASQALSSRRGGADGSATQRADRSFEGAQRTSERDGLSMLAKETGGRAVFDQNSLVDDLNTIGRDMGTYYSLAYTPPVGKVGEEHRIEVKVPGKKINTRYRRGYLTKNADQWMAERLEGALNLGLVSNPLGVGLGAGELRTAESGNSILPLHILLPVTELSFLDQGQGEMAQIAVEVMARHLGSETLALTQRRLRIRKPEEGQPRTGFALDLELLPGEHTIAVGVRDDLGLRSSFVTTTLQVGVE